MISVKLTDVRIDARIEATAAARVVGHCVAGATDWYSTMSALGR
jgi:hypothetical protein